MSHLLAGGEQEAQHGGVLLVDVVVPPVAGAVLRHLRRHHRLALGDELGGGVTDDAHCLVRLLLPREEQAER
eukprot:9416076-Pyramimonas_sp.AAC.1